ncbi:hypothetical protein MKX01_009934, partial [Papaver californicum]
DWLENARDWAVSRSRFWGTPLPIWISADDKERVVINSIENLEKLSGIDHITIPSSRCPEFGVLRRVEDVFDCWFESGSMPYNNFPGHFVAEGLDQTRGWFYTLMVLNLICNGLVLAEDGKKMSKRLKNYPPPTDIIDNYGAFYRVVKDVFLPWYNAYRFLGLAPFLPFDQLTIQKSLNVLDQWINSATESLVHFVRQEMDAYRLYTVVPYLLKFIDNLTNIYVKQDCRTALSTLYHVLLTTCKVMSPFTPFFTEVLYQNLHKVSKGSEESVHYCSFPQAVGKREGRISARHNKPLKAPLREMVVVHPDPNFLEDISGKLSEYVLEELNVRVTEELIIHNSSPQIWSRTESRSYEKKAGLEPTDMVEVYYESLRDDKSLQNVVNLQKSYIRDALSFSLLPWDTAPPHAVVIREESIHDISELAFVIRLAKQTLSFSSEMARSTWS